MKKLITSRSVTVMFEGEPTRSLPKTHDNYQKAVSLLRSKEFDEMKDKKRLIALFDAGVAIVKASKGKIRVEKGNVIIDDVTMPDNLRDAIAKEVSGGGSAKPFLKFWEKLKQNPDKNSVDNLFRFVNAGKIPITPEGDILAYKTVGRDFKDLYSHTFDNSVGLIVKVPRDAVNPNPNIDCSHGLHAACLNYALNHYGGSNDVVIVVRINPKDVCAVPRDYNGQKLRCCEYFVVCEYKKWDESKANIKEIEEIVASGRTYYLPPLKKGMFEEKRVTMKRPAKYIAHVRADSREQATKMFKKMNFGDVKIQQCIKKTKVASKAKEDKLETKVTKKKSTISKIADAIKSVGKKKQRR